jgi:ligand-binding sensor domain-containing protein
MHFDDENNLWCGVLSRFAVAHESGDGLFKFDGNHITHYHMNNSELLSNSVIDIAIDNDGNIWVATYAGGLAKFTQGGEWEIFHPDNTAMLNTDVESVVVDNDGCIWYGSIIGLTRFKE